MRRSATGPTSSPSRWRGGRIVGDGPQGAHLGVAKRRRVEPVPGQPGERDRPPLGAGAQRKLHDVEQPVVGDGVGEHLDSAGDRARVGHQQRPGLHPATGGVVEGDPHRQGTREQMPGAAGQVGQPPQVPFEPWAGGAHGRRVVAQACHHQERALRGGGPDRTLGGDLPPACPADVDGPRGGEQRSVDGQQGLAGPQPQVVGEQVGGADRQDPQLDAGAGDRARHLPDGAVAAGDHHHPCPGGHRVAGLRIAVGVHRGGGDDRGGQARVPASGLEDATHHGVASGGGVHHRPQRPGRGLAHASHCARVGDRSAARVGA